MILHPNVDPYQRPTHDEIMDAMAVLNKAGMRVDARKMVSQDLMAAQQYDEQRAKELKERVTHAIGYFHRLRELGVASARVRYYHRPRADAPTIDQIAFSDGENHMETTYALAQAVSNQALIDMINYAFGGANGVYLILVKEAQITRLQNLFVPEPEPVVEHMDEPEVAVMLPEGTEVTA